jgi:hypothetical protein
VPRSRPAQAQPDAWRQVLLWHEHTWGAADSIGQPDRQGVVDQWVYKRAFAVESDRQSRALLDAASPAPGPAFQVVNTQSFARSGLVLLDAAATSSRDRVLDAAGRVLPSQRLADGRLAVRVPDVPAFGAIRLTVAAGAPGAPDHRVARRAALRNRRADRRAQRDRQAARMEETACARRRRVRVPLYEDTPLTVVCVFDAAADRDDAFDILVDDRKMAGRVREPGAAANREFKVTLPLAETAGKSQVTIAFRARPGARTAGLLDVRTVQEHLE